MTQRIASLPRAAFAGLGLLAALAPAALRADAVAQSCADCCKLPCIEAEILKAKEQRAAYQQMSKRTNWTKETYEAAERAAGEAAEAKRVAALPGLETCNYYLPENQSYPESKEFILAGFKLRRDEQGRLLPVDYTLTTDLDRCAANGKALELAPRVSPCEGIGRAAVAHEEKHVEDCLVRRSGKGRPSYDKVAAGEVRAYDVEIAELERVRLESAEACNEKSCAVKTTDWDRAAEKLKLDVLALLGKPKPPSNSPLRRTPGGR